MSSLYSPCIYIIMSTMRNAARSTIMTTMENAATTTIMTTARNAAAAVMTMTTTIIMRTRCSAVGGWRRLCPATGMS